MCYLRLALISSLTREQETTHWESGDIKTLEGILQISPDILPCHLAIIVHAKCQDVNCFLVTQLNVLTVY